MKRLTLLILIFLLVCPIKGQSEAGSIINSIYLSGNSSFVFNANTENLLGYGAGLDVLFREDKRLNVHVAMEFNHTSQFKYEMYNDRWSTSYNVIYKANCLTLLGGPSLFLGDGMNFFTETGIFYDMSMPSKIQGERMTCSTDNEVYSCDYSEFSSKESFSNVLGLYARIGYRIHISKIITTLSIEYKFGLSPLISYDPYVNIRHVRILFGIEL